MSNQMDDTIKKVMQELGRRGGKVSSKKKRAATKKSLAKARAARWPKKKELVPAISGKLGQGPLTKPKDKPK